MAVNTEWSAYMQMMHDIYTQYMTGVYGAFESKLKELVKLEREKAVTGEYLPCAEPSQLIVFSFITEPDAFAFANAHASVYFQAAGTSRPGRESFAGRKRPRRDTSGSAGMPLQSTRTRVTIVTSD